MSPRSRPLDVFVVAGEESGDVLASAFMRELGQTLNGAVHFRGVGGPRMEAAGLVSLFPMDDITAIGFGQVIAGLPRILRRMGETVRAILKEPPDVLVLVDAPDFNHRVAARVRARLPDLPVVKYVAPTVWVWRPGRAKAMRPYTDHVLALLPFEPEAMARLGGPPTTYVGHPLLGVLDRLTPDAGDAARRAAEPPLLLALPGSRRSELARLGADFGAAFAHLRASGRDFELALPTLPRREAEVRAITAGWPVQPRIITDEGEKQAAFRRARAALAASGTVTLELALAGVPTVAAYKVHTIEAWLAPILLSGTSIILTNRILGEDVVPEFLQTDCVPGKLAAALEAAMNEGPARERQLNGFRRLREILKVDGKTPAQRAAQVVLDVVGERRSA
ncbi:lipid-A-disaccharide synthase [Starkeya sp. ORNL1]|uniref:lipid-A-disaccharide synthase n=1 Tax=Starkeya sp. ORNL1 TaxID=2709380 RepID=UPI0014637A59|nr:lipid-A-disaccharide synthase [Starkeya sp. ORNL1]QJP12847.1 lipid-A-disaccharide synthase [Starkeya sp. ORNL1]